jgi:hypothetical protein
MFASQHTFRYTRTWNEVETSVRVSQNLGFFSTRRNLLVKILFNILKIVHFMIIWYRSDFFWKEQRKHLGM